MQRHPQGKLFLLDKSTRLDYHWFDLQGNSSQGYIYLWVWPFRAHRSRNLACTSNIVTILSNPSLAKKLMVGTEREQQFPLHKNDQLDIFHLSVRHQG